MLQDEWLDETRAAEIARQVREELARRRISRQALADLARISISTLEKALSGSRSFTLATVIRLEEALGTSLRGAAPAPAMKIIRVWEEGNVGFVTWQAGTLKGTDEFLVRNGKIAVQAVFLSDAPGAPAR